MGINLESKRFSKASVRWFFGGMTVYLLWLYFFIGFGEHHFYSILIFSFLYFISDTSRGILIGWFGFFAWWLLYDSMRFFPSYLYTDIHIVEPYELEKMLFGFDYNGIRVIPCEYFKDNHHPAVDLYTGFMYLMWMPFPMIYGIYLYFKNKPHLMAFSMTFIMTNIVGLIIYYAYPAAPPWYVDQYGFEENFEILGSAAGFLRFDQILGVQVFENMYVKNSNVFAAIPSLHAAYPTIMLYYTLKNKEYAPKVLALLLLIGIWFGAIYSSHHYTIDVILGIFCAIFAILIFSIIKRKTNWFSFLDRMVNYIE